MGWYGYGRGLDPAFWLVAGAFWLVLLGVIVWAVLRLVPGRSAPPAARREVDAPEEILDRRLARGEIDLETYQAQRAALVSARGTQP